jgi:hypothetical protein
MAAIDESANEASILNPPTVGRDVELMADIPGGFKGEAQHRV